MLFRLTLYWLPAARLEWASEWGYIRIPTPRTILLPAITLAIVYVGYISRLVRGSLIVVQDFIRTARAKGLPEWRVIVFHALRGALLPVVSFSSLALADVLTGAVVVKSKIKSANGISQQVREPGTDFTVPGHVAHGFL